MAPIVHKDDVKPFIRDGHMSPPLSRRGSEISMDKPMTNPTLHAKTITANATLDPKDRVEFDTNVDQLMRAIQGDNDTDSHAMTPAPSPCVEEVSARSSPASCAGSTISNGAASKQRKYTCDGPNCNKSFTQKTHLDIHKRTHTGNRPYVCGYRDAYLDGRNMQLTARQTCTFEGCNLTFSQLGNLKVSQPWHGKSGETKRAGETDLTRHIDSRAPPHRSPSLQVRQV